MKLRIWPFDSDKRVDRYELTELGAYRGGSVVGVVSAIPKSIAEAEVGIVSKQFPELKLEPIVRTVESFGPGNYCYAKLDYERASVVISSVGTFEKSRKAVGNEIVSATREFLKAGKACEKHLADQLLVPVSVFLEERQWCCDAEFFRDWSVAVQKETKHFTTNQDVIDTFLHD